jgi:polar amino acid transport system substrate-binding protein
MRIALSVISMVIALASSVAAAADGPDCSRTFTLALHEHGLLYSSQTGAGIDKDFSDELMRRSGCKLSVSVLPRARIWQLIESGALDFSLSGISNAERERYAGFAWYFSNKYYLLLRDGLKLKSLTEFQKHPELKLGVIRSFWYSNNANLLIDQLRPANRLVYATGFDPLFKIFQSGQIQAMIIEPFDYPQIENTSIREQSMIIDTEDAAIPHGLIMSKKSLSALEQEKWRALVQSMRRDGSVAKIFRKYMKPELADAITTFKD